MNVHSICLGDIKLAYEIYGTGEQVVIAFHGHSKCAKDFEFLKSGKRRVVSIHLFHHNHSEFPIDRIRKHPLSEKEWGILINKILEKENLKQFHLIAYSQGGRFALKTLELFPDKVKSVTLLSPDGINQNSYYDRASQRAFDRRLMEILEKKPKLFAKTVQLIGFLGKVSPSIVNLAEYFSDSESRMICASRTWRNFRNMKSNPEKIGKIIRDRKIPFNLVMGKYDGIFPPVVGKKYMEACGLEEEPIVVESGHDFFKSNVKELIDPHLPF